MNDWSREERGGLYSQRARDAFIALDARYASGAEDLALKELAMSYGEDLHPEFSDEAIAVQIALLEELKAYSDRVVMVVPPIHPSVWRA